MRNPEDHWLTVDQTAQTLHLTPHHVYRSIRSGIMPSAMLGSIRVVPRGWVAAASATSTRAASRTRIDWPAAYAAYDNNNPDNNTPGTEHANDLLPATAG